MLRLLVMPLLPDRAFDIQWLLGTQEDSAYTPPKSSMEPENAPFEKANHLPNPDFGVPC